MRKTITIILLITAVFVPFIAFNVLPVIGDPTSAPNTHVSDHYIEHAIDECNSPNMVTAVIVDYRAFDTMFETTVMFLAGLSVVMILANRPKKKIFAPSSFCFTRFRTSSGTGISSIVTLSAERSVQTKSITVFS